jgi:HEAT repeat protein
MSESLHEMVNALRDPMVTRRREALMRLERDWDIERIQAFVVHAETLNPAVCLELCGVLAHATTPELVTLLGAYARSGEPVLRQRAIEALERVPVAARQETVVGLLQAAEPATREAACRMLGVSGDPAPVPELTDRLRDESPTVVIAAIEALRRLDAREVVREVQNALNHRDPRVRAAALEALVELASGTFPTQTVAALLEADPEENVRMAAAAALGARTSRPGRRALLGALESDDRGAVRSAAAMALANYSDEEVLKRLLITTREASDPALALACRRALGAADAMTLLETCRGMLDDDEASLRLEAARSLGDLSLRETSRLLGERLRVEKEPTVRAALLDALGRGGWREHWTAIRGSIGRDAVEARAAIEALGDLLDDGHIHDYAGLLADVETGSLQELILRRLVLYGRIHGLPPALRSVLAPFLAEHGRPTAVLAAEAMGYLREADAVEDLLAAAGETHERDLVRATAVAALRLLDDDAMALHERAGVENLTTVARVLGHAGSLGERGAELCVRLARSAARNTAGAEEALEAAANVEPASLVTALAEAAPDEAEAMIRAWKRLPDAQRAAVPLDFVTLLRSPAGRVRLAVLESLTFESGAPLLPVIADMAITDGDESVRVSARRATRRVVGL